MTEEQEIKADALTYREEYLKQEFFDALKFKEMTSDGKEFLRFVVMTSMIFAMRKDRIKPLASIEQEFWMPLKVLDFLCDNLSDAQEKMEAMWKEICKIYPGLPKEGFESADEQSKR